MVNRFDPIILSQSPSPLLSEARGLLLSIGVDEMGWTREETIELLEWPHAATVAVRENGENVVASAVVGYGGRPFPSETFDAKWNTAAYASPVDVSVVGTTRSHRRRVMEGDMSVLDALVKGIYWASDLSGFTDILSLMQPDRMLVFGAAVGIPVKVETAGQHKWCRRKEHDEFCPLWYGCRMNRTEGEIGWQTRRPDFWEYVMAGM
jgi:hypothetical protein